MPRFAGLPTVQLSKCLWQTQPDRHGIWSGQGVGSACWPGSAGGCFSLSGSPALQAVAVSPLPGSTGGIVASVPSAGSESTVRSCSRAAPSFVIPRCLHNLSNASSFEQNEYSISSTSQHVLSSVFFGPAESRFRLILIFDMARRADGLTLRHGFGAGLSPTSSNTSPGSKCAIPTSSLRTRIADVFDRLAYALRIALISSAIVGFCLSLDDSRLAVW